MSTTDPKREEHKSLVKYAKPIIVSTGTRRAKHHPKDSKNILDADLGFSNSEDILNSILPPLEYTKGKQQLYIEQVLSTPAIKEDVIELQKELDKRLQTRQARETGICPIREELYAQTFDELIRQITINCSHRGLLLVRVRDEMRMTIQAYQTLYESALAYGMRCALQGEQRRIESYNKITNLENECEDLELTVHSLEDEIRDIIRRDEITRGEALDVHRQDIADDKTENQRLRDELERKLLNKKADPNAQNAA